CRRKKMYINFEDIHWNEWIVQPRGYQAYECVGQCHFPLNSHLTPTKYTAIKSLLHATYPRKIKPACCVPTKLQPISLLYYDDNNVLTYKFKYEEMMVAQCGCR
ncbi:hypothetical protein HELRODRAFT_137522, partial [Helobdella robusta]|uniref:TGF-beta family profile domain-containing protein n=1 Tax=Helobdella robusta TaxID=6412 RepID=T1EIL1_HELRO